MELRELMWERHHAFLLDLANENIVPGSLLEVEYDPLDGWEAFLEIATIGLYSGSMPQLVHHDGNIWDLLSEEQEQDYASELVAGNIVQSDVKHSFALEASSALPQYGISFTGSLNTNFSVVMRVGKVQSRVFQNTGIFYQGVQSLLAMKEKDEELWEWINGDYFVSESYYTTEIKLVFHSEGSLSAKGEFENAGFQAGGNVQANWSSDNILTLSGEPSVPFAVRGAEI